MNTLAETILERTSGLSEGAPICAKELLHLGSRAAVDQALARLVKRGRLMRVGRGVYVRPVEGRFGKRAPSASTVVEQVAGIKGETVATHGAAAANKLGLTTQVPVRAVYLTSGPSRRLKLGSEEVELRHAPAWQFVLANHPAGEVLRALAWLGPEQAGEALRRLKHKLSSQELKEIASARAILPSWLAKHVSDVVVNG
jgi:hypothetical protein